MKISTTKATVVRTIELKVQLESENEIVDFKHILNLMESYLCGVGTIETSPSYMQLSRKFVEGLKQQIYL